MHKLLLISFLALSLGSCLKKNPLSQALNKITNGDKGGGRSSKSKSNSGKDFGLSVPESTKSKQKVAISWDTVRGAVKYEVVIAYDEDCEDKVVTITSKKSDGDDVMIDADGEYYVCVYAINSSNSKKAAHNNGKKMRVGHDPSAVPDEKAVGISFTDTDGSDGEISGSIYIERAEDESYISHYVLYWGSSETEQLAMIDELEATGEDLVYTFAANTAIPAGATHILVFTRNDNGEMEACLAILIVDEDTSVSSSPGYAAASVSFTDIDGTANELQGSVDITKASSEADLTHYVLYWGSNATTKQSSTPIATIAKTGGNISYTINANTAIPGGATHFLVFTKNAAGENSSNVSVAFDDIAVPVNQSGALAFTDRDGDVNELDGDLDINMAASEADVTHYVVYWGSNATTKLSGTPIVTIAKTGANLQYTIVANTALPGGATHFLVYTKNADGEGPVRAVAIVDDF